MRGTDEIEEADNQNECPEGSCIECWDCEVEAEAVANDPRDPPIEEGLCLCDCCFINAAEEQILELQDRISELKEEIKKWRRNKRSRR